MDSPKTKTYTSAKLGLKSMQEINMLRKEYKTATEERERERRKGRKREWEGREEPFKSDHITWIHMLIIPSENYRGNWFISVC